MLRFFAHTKFKIKIQVRTLTISVDSHVYLSINIGGRSVPFITDAVIAMFIVTAVIAGFVVLSTRKLQKIPAGMQKGSEALVDLVNNMTKGQMGHHYKAFAPFICTVLLFLALSNMIAIFNIIPSGEALSHIFRAPRLEHFELALHPPTKNFNVTICMALITMVIVVAAEFKYKGFKGWLKSFYKPTPVSGFIKILDYAVRPMSLCLRLFGNILGGYIAMALLYASIPLILPAFVSMYFDMFDGGLQAYVFIFLTTMYLAESVEEAEEVN